jgi:hypothetical protein
MPQRCSRWMVAKSPKASWARRDVIERLSKVILAAPTPGSGDEAKKHGRQPRSRLVYPSSRHARRRVAGVDTARRRRPDPPPHPPCSSYPIQRDPRPMPRTSKAGSTLRTTRMGELLLKRMGDRARGIRGYDSLRRYAHRLHARRRVAGVDTARRRRPDPPPHPPCSSYPIAAPAIAPDAANLEGRVDLADDEDGGATAEADGGYRARWRVRRGGQIGP